MLNGAAEGFWLLAAATPPTARSAIITPAFGEPAAALRANGHDPASACTRTTPFAPPARPRRHRPAVRHQPVQPHGHAPHAAAITSLVRPGRTLLVDESFMDFVAHPQPSVAGRPGTVVLRSLTKMYSIAGLRAGYLIADPELVARLDARRQAWPVNGLALAAMTAWARQPPDDALIDRIARAAHAARRRARRAGVHVYPGAANFLLAKVPAGTVERLRGLGIAVRPTEDLGLDAEHIRIAVREDAERLIAAL